MPVNRAMVADFTTLMTAFEPESTGGHVVGVGLDVVDVAAFAEQLALPGSRFVGFFRTGERAEIAARGGGVEHWAARWAAKEAVIKAWSALFHGRPPILGEDALGLVEVVGDGWGRPRIATHGALRVELSDYDIQVSLSHDGPIAAAYVVLSAACKYAPSSRLSSVTASVCSCPSRTEKLSIE